MQQVDMKASVPEELVACNVVVITADHKRFLCPKLVMKASLLIAEMLEENNASGAPAGDVPLVTVDSATLTVVYEFLEHHSCYDRPVREIDRPLKADLSSLVDPWDWKYVTDSLLMGKSEKHNDLLFAVLNAANFLNIPPLRDLCSGAVANILRNKTEDEILEFFGISEPFTKDQENEICRDFPWLKDPPSAS